jgi:hypothetical protein
MATFTAYFPTSKPKQIIWLDNWIIQIVIHGPALGLSAAQIAATVADATWAKYCIERVGPSAKTWAESITAAIKTNLFEKTEGSPVPFSAFALPTPIPTQVASGALKRIFDLIASIKLLPACLPAVCEALRIVGDEDPENPDAIPKLGKIVVRGGEIIIPFTKNGHLGVYIECSIDGGAWAFLTIDTTNPYNDTRPLPPGKAAEKRRYRLCFWDGEPTNVWVTTEDVAFAG